MESLLLSFSVPIQMLLGGLNNIMKMNTFLRNTISELYDALAERLQCIRDTTYLLSQNIKEKLGYRQTLKDNEVNEADKELTEATDQQQDDDKQYDTVLKIKSVYEWIHVKEFKVEGSLNVVNARMIIANLTPHTGIRTRAIYSFKSEIDEVTGEIVDYSKTFTSLPVMFTSFEEIQA